MTCSRCSTNLTPDLTFCPTCGQVLSPAGVAAMAPPPPPPPGVFAPAPGMAMPYGADPYANPYMNIDPPFLGLSRPGLADGTALARVMWAGGIVLLAVFFLPWVMGRFTLWSWTSIPGRGMGMVKFFMFYPLIAGGLMMAAAKGKLPVQTLAAIALALGALPLVVMLTQAPSMMGGGSLRSSGNVTGYMQFFGTIGLGIGLTLRVLRTDTRLGRGFIGVSVALVVLGYLIPVQIPYMGESHNALWMAWKMMNIPRAPAGIKMLGFVMILTPFIALSALLLLKQVAQGDRDPAQGLGRILGVYFVFWMPILIGFTMLLLVGRLGSEGGMMLWFMVKVVAYTAVVVVSLNHGATALLSTAENPS